MISRVLIAAAVTSIGIGAGAYAQSELGAVEIRSEKLADNLYMLSGRGGNMALLIGPDGAVLVDDEFAPVTLQVRAAIARLTDKPVRFVLNTHWHPDHTGGNAAFGEAGSVIVAHDNTRKRLTTRQVLEFFKMEVPPQPPAALPVVTFTHAVSLHLNGEDVDVVHVPAAHTDSDAILYFAKANVVHMGDVMQGQFYGFIDIESGGSIDGVIKSLGEVLARTNAGTRFILGHAPMIGRGELESYRGMLVTVRERVAKALAAGRTRQQVVAERPTKDFDARYGNGTIKPDVFVQRVYDDLERGAGRGR